MVKAKKSTVSVPAPRRDKANILLNLFSGSRTPLPNGLDVLIRISDGGQHRWVDKYYKGSAFNCEVPCYENNNDNYTVLVTADDHRDVGFFPVKVSSELPVAVDLMLVPKRAKYQFPTWEDLKKNYGKFAGFLNCGGDDPATKKLYEGLRHDRPAALASLLNLTAAMSAIHLPNLTPLDYFKRIEWDDSLAQDRFFGFADARIVDQVRTALAQHQFAPEPSPGLFHGDATSSYKQVQFGEGNVQLTFHENTVQSIDGVKCIRVEPDIDDYQDLGAHALLEVIPNTLSHGRTDPQGVYVLRWIAGRRAGVPEFDPGYTLTA